MEKTWKLEITVSSLGSSAVDRGLLDWMAEFIPNFFKEMGAEAVASLTEVEEGNKEDDDDSEKTEGEDGKTS